MIDFIFMNLINNDVIMIIIMMKLKRNRRARVGLSSGAQESYNKMAAYSRKRESSEQACLPT